MHLQNFMKKGMHQQNFMEKSMHLQNFMSRKSAGMASDDDRSNISEQWPAAHMGSVSALRRCGRRHVRCAGVAVPVPIATA